MIISYIYFQALRLKGIQNFKAKDFGLKPVKERVKKQLTALFAYQIIASIYSNDVLFFPVDYNNKTSVLKGSRFCGASWILQDGFTNVGSGYWRFPISISGIPGISENFGLNDS